MSNTTITFTLENSVTLFGDLTIPMFPRGLIIFVHGSGSSRLSTRNQFVARTLQKYGFATLLFDLLTTEEEQIDEFTRELRFNIPLLVTRLVGVTRKMKERAEFKDLPVGYFGASTGAAAALIASTSTSNSISVVISRGGRPDLAKGILNSVSCPTLLIVGGHDYEVIELNKLAQKHLTRCKSKLEIIPGATHLFEEPGTLEAVAQTAASWLQSIWGHPTEPKRNFKIKETPCR